MSAAEPFSRIANESLRNRIASIDNLPTLPEIYNELVSELSSSDVSMKRVSDIVSHDVAIAAKLLQVVNSAYFGISKEVQSVQQAVNYLGIDTVKNIVLSAGVYASASADGTAGDKPAELYRQGVTVGTKARFIAYSMGLNRGITDNALTAGLLHDVGKLVLLVHFENEHRQAVEAAQAEGLPLHMCQERIIGANDAIIGSYLLSTWGLSSGIVNAVAWHYAPSQAQPRMLNEVTAVHLAYASEYDESNRINDRERSAFDYTYAQELGIEGQLQSIRGLTAEAVASAGMAM